MNLNLTLLALNNSFFNAFSGKHTRDKVDVQHGYWFYQDEQLGQRPGNNYNQNKNKNMSLTLQKLFIEKT